MKTTKRIITAIFIIFCCTLFSAQQQAHTAPQHLGSIKKATYIFEGTIMQQTHKPNTTLTCSVFEIKKILKGSPQIKLGTIKVETEQSTPHMRVIDGGAGLHIGSTYIIFSIPTDTNTFHSITTDNPLAVRCIDNIVFIGGGAKWGWRNPTQFKTIDSLYSFFRENGLTVQEQIAPTDTTK